MCSMEKENKVNRQRMLEICDKMPIMLKAISGFNSCMTVSITSAIFIWSVHIAIANGKSTWPDVPTAVIMMTGPIIIAWNFVNARLMINSVISYDQTQKEQEAKNEDDEETPVIKHPLMAGAGAIERELIGAPAMILRAIAGTVSVHVICFCSLLFTWTIHDALINGKPLPSDYELLLVVVGPVITSWNFVRASVTLDSVIKSAGMINRARNKLANVLRTNEK